MTEVEETALPFDTPKDWQTAYVGEEFFIILGKMLDAEKNVGTPKPYLGNKSVQWGRIDTDELSMIKLTPGDLRRYRLVDGDLLVCEGGDIGRSAIWSGQMEECYFQKALHRVRPRGGYSPVLLRYLLEYYSKTGFLLNFATQTSIAHLPKDKFEVLPLPKPSLEEQEAIAEALSDADALIEGLERLIAKKRLIKQGAMQDLLTAKRRLPGFSGEWVERKLGDVARLATGSRNNQDKDPMGDFPFFVRSDTVERIRTWSYDCEAILVPGEGRIGEIFHYINGKFDVHQRVYCISAFTEDVSGRFIHTILRQFFGKHAMTNTVKATVDSLRRPTFTEFSFLCPPSLAEQDAIAAVLTDMDAEIQALGTRLEKARQVKEGMMQNLLTGRIRLV